MATNKKEGGNSLRFSCQKKFVTPLRTENDGQLIVASRRGIDILGFNNNLTELGLEEEHDEGGDKNCHFWNIENLEKFNSGITQVI